MKAMLHGVRRIDMTDAQTGRVIRGYSLFIGFPSEGVVGQEVLKRFIDDDLANSCKWHPEVGKQLFLDFTPRGKICEVTTLDAAK